jgi:hypothetical protein
MKKKEKKEKKEKKRKRKKGLMQPLYRASYKPG